MSLCLQISLPLGIMTLTYLFGGHDSVHNRRVRKEFFKESELTSKDEEVTIETHISGICCVCCCSIISAMAFRCSYIIFQSSIWNADILKKINCERAISNHDDDDGISWMFKEPHDK